SMNDQQFGPITFDRLRSYAPVGLVTRSDLLRKAGSPTWTRAQGVRGLFPVPPPRPTVPAVRRPTDIILSAQDRLAAPPISEVRALQHVTAEALRHAAGQHPDPLRWAQDWAAKEPDGGAGGRRR